MSTFHAIWAALATAGFSARLVMSVAVLAAACGGNLTRWLCDRYELQMGTGRAVRCWLARRWYGTGCRVTRRGTPYALDRGIYRVLGWEGRHSCVPWVQVAEERYWELGEPQWVPVTMLRPLTVPVFRPSWRARVLIQHRPAAGPGGGGK